MAQLSQLVQQVTPVEIPDALRSAEYQFCKVGWTKLDLDRLAAQTKDEATAKSILKEFKNPRGKSWETKTFSWNNPELQAWTQKGGNYGVVAGSLHQYDGQQAALFILDADELQAWQQAGFFDDLPKQTTQVQSSAENKRHFYFLSNIKSSKAHKELPGLGHFKFERSQVVGPGSLHPSGVRYQLVDESAPAYVDAEILTKACVRATQALRPDLAAEVKEMLGVKDNHSGQAKDKIDALESKLKKAKVDRLKQNQQLEAENEKLRAQIDPVKDLISEIGKDESINLCLRRLNASIPTLHRFEKAVSYKGKIGEGEHFLRLAWAVALIKSGYTDTQMHQMAAFFDDYTHPRTQQQLDSVRTWVKDGGKYYPCAEIRAYLPPEMCQGCSWTPPGQDEAVTCSACSGDAQPADVEISTKKAGDNILKRGKVLKFVIKQYHKNHVGDDVAGKVLTLSYVSGSSLTSSGLQPGITGDAQTGKSDAMDASLHTLPSPWVMRTGLSDKAAAYIEFVPGQVVHSDDLKWTDGLIYMLKISMSSFQKGAEYTTVMKVGGKLKAVPLTIPPRMLWWITGADAAPDNQIESRQYPVDVDQSKKHAVAVSSAIASRRACRKPKFYVDKGILTCRYILGQIRESGPFSVEIPFSEWIDYKVPEDYRGQQQFFDLIDALAILNFKQRKEIDGWIQADLQDYREAKEIFTSKNESHNTGLNAAELQLVMTMATRTDEWTQADLVKAVGKSQSVISKRLQSIMGKTAYVTMTKDKSEGLYRTNKVDMRIFGNVIVGWKKNIPTCMTFIPAPLQTF